jgi:UDP-2,3-diacylglucosamine pyrophosphatase LpxH
MKRKVELAVVSDVHLGTYGCHAEELLNYLKSIEPKTLILNGDIIDAWQFSKRYFPEKHHEVLKEIVSMLGRGTEVYYLTGNHDEILRRFSDFHLGNFRLLDKIVLNIDGKICWFFHGDVFDVTMQHSKWLAKLGGKGYDFLILINKAANYISEHFLGKGKMSLSKKIKNSVKTAVSFISNFENTAAEIAIENGYDYVICGHIHEPTIKTIETKKGNINYLNSGDWIENLTALEYNDKQWRLYSYMEDLMEKTIDDTEVVNELYEANKTQLLSLLGFEKTK